MLTALIAAAGAAPTAMALAGVGMPDLVNGHAEVFVSDAWSVELGAGRRARAAADRRGALTYTAADVARDHNLRR